MSQAENSAAASLKQKRAYRKGNPLSAIEKRRRLVLKKKETHKEVKVFIQNDHKDQLLDLCEKTGLTQAEVIESLIELAASLDLLKQK